MIVSIRKKTLEHAAFLAVIALAITIAIVGVSFTTNYAVGADNITNLTVIAIVNVTNTEPNITSLTVDDDVDNPSGEIDLTANDAKVVTCNATVFDFNGWQDIVNVNNTNATLFIDSVGSDAADDNNTHYTNASCGRCRQASEASDPARTAYCDCRFAVQYYANDSANWVCNFTVTDNGGNARPEFKINLSDTETSSAVRVTKLLALDTPTILDYGNLSVTETSSEVVHNVTNVGNIDLNISLRGYGGENESVGINHTMLCDFGNISIGEQKYALGSHLTGSTDFNTMVVLQNQTTNTNLSLPQRINDNNFGFDRNSTLWRIHVPLSVGGLCNGTIIFGAVDAEQ